MRYTQLQQVSLGQDINTTQDINTANIFNRSNEKLGQYNAINQKISIAGRKTKMSNSEIKIKNEKKVIRTDTEKFSSEHPKGILKFTL